MKSPNATREVRNLLWVESVIFVLLSLALMMGPSAWTTPLQYWFINASWATGAFGAACYICGFILHLSIINDSN